MTVATPKAATVTLDERIVAVLDTSLDPVRLLPHSAWIEPAERCVAQSLGYLTQGDRQERRRPVRARRGGAMNACEQRLMDRVQELEDLLRQEREAHRKTTVRAALVEAAARQATEAASVVVYIARTDTGAVVYEGEQETAAICEARLHYGRTREHVTIDNSNWNTRQHGGVRRDSP
jgi:hypothetical protein